MFSIECRRIHLKRAMNEVDRLHELLERTLGLVSLEILTRAHMIRLRLLWTVNNNPVFMPGENPFQRHLERWITLAERVRRMTEEAVLDEEDDTEADDTEGGDAEEDETEGGDAEEDETEEEDVNEGSGNSRPARGSRSRRYQAPPLDPAHRQNRDTVDADTVAILLGHIQKFKELENGIRRSIENEMDALRSRNRLYAAEAPREIRRAAIMKSGGRKSPLRHCTLASDV